MERLGKDQCECKSLWCPVLEGTTTAKSCVSNSLPGRSCLTRKGSVGEKPAAQKESAHESAEFRLYDSWVVVMGVVNLQKRSN